jgi:hypothetical protein
VDIVDVVLECLVPAMMGAQIVPLAVVVGDQRIPGYHTAA